jgi:hypothetical protein
VPTSPSKPRTVPARPPRVASTPQPATQPPAPHRIAPDPDDPVRHRYPLRSQANHTSEMNAVVDEITGVSLEYRQLLKGDQPDLWIRAFANNLGMLAQGVGTRQPTGTNTIFFIPKEKTSQKQKCRPTAKSPMGALSPASAPTNKNETASASPLEGTGSSIRASHLPRPQASPPASASSTAPSQHPGQNSSA